MDKIKIIKPAVVPVWLPEARVIEENILRGARACYVSESKGREADVKLLKRLWKNGHHSVFEHGALTLLFRIDRITTQSLTRHRLMSPSQESTRFCDYGGKPIEFVDPHPFIERGTDEYVTWKCACKNSAVYYRELRGLGKKPQMARSVLINSLASTVVCTANIREWLHILKVRCAPDAHPQFRQVMLPTLKFLNEWSPLLFRELAEKHGEDIEKFDREAPIGGAV